MASGTAWMRAGLVLAVALALEPHGAWLVRDDERARLRAPGRREEGLKEEDEEEEVSFAEQPTTATVLPAKADAAALQQQLQAYGLDATASAELVDSLGTDALNKVVPALQDMPAEDQAAVAGKLAALPSETTVAMKGVVESLDTDSVAVILEVAKDVPTEEVGTIMNSTAGMPPDKLNSLMDKVQSMPEAERKVMVASLGGMNAPVNASEEERAMYCLDENETYPAAKLGTCDVDMNDITAGRQTELQRTFQTAAEGVVSCLEKIAPVEADASLGFLEQVSHYLEYGAWGVCATSESLHAYLEECPVCSCFREFFSAVPTACKVKFRAMFEEVQVQMDAKVDQQFSDVTQGYVTGSTVANLCDAKVYCGQSFAEVEAQAAGKRLESGGVKFVYVAGTVLVLVLLLVLYILLATFRRCCCPSRPAAPLADQQ